MLAKSFLEQPPRSNWLNPSAFLSVGRLKALVYSVAIEHAEKLQNAF